MRGENTRPIIVRRKKIVAADGHHGGAWKVAYADFVTAMMAFFLLMWLLNATTEKQRKGLADYFSPTIPMNRVSGGGDGSFWGDDIFAEQSLAQNGNGAALLHPTDYRQAKGDDGVNLVEAPAVSGATPSPNDAEELLERLTRKGGESMAELLAQRHVVSRVTDEGLVIDIYETPDAMLWNGDGVEPAPLLAATLRTVAEVLGLVGNEIAVNAHLAARPLVLAQNPIWEVSAERADVTRTLLEVSGLDPARIQRVTGFADRKPIDGDPMSHRNNRLEIVLLRDKP